MPTPVFAETTPDRSPLPGRVAYVNARLIDPATGTDRIGTLLTEGETIVDIGQGLFADGVPEGVQVVDCTGLVLAPGLVDMHVHLREPGHEHKETIETGSRAAAAGGVTTIACMANTAPVIDDIALVDFIRRRARETGLVNVLPVAAITKGLKGEQLVEMGLLAEAGAAYFSDDGLPVRDTLVMRRALSYAGGMGLLIAQHAEDHSLAGCGCMNEGETATRLGLPGIPSAAETVIVERDIRLLELTGGKARYHVAHISTAEAVEAVRQAKRRGLPVTAEVTPHHFTLNDRAVGDYRTFAKMAPPLRAARDVDAMIEGLADGTIDAVATDHAPHDQDSKRVPFAHAANGVVGLETMLPLTLELVRDGHLSLIDAVAAMTLKPADLLGIAAGRLAKGAPADLVLFSTEHEWVLNAALLHSKSKNTPFDGRTLRGRALRTVVRGRTVFQLA